MVKEEKSFALEVSTCKLWGGQHRQLRDVLLQKCLNEFECLNVGGTTLYNFLTCFLTSIRYSYHRTCQDYGQLITKRIYIKKSGPPNFFNPKSSVHQVVICDIWNRFVLYRH